MLQIKSIDKVTKECVYYKTNIVICLHVCLRTTLSNNCASMKGFQMGLLLLNVLDTTVGLATEQLRYTYCSL